METYAYTMKYRPICIGITVPRAGVVIQRANDANRTARRPFGAIHYFRQLTAKELATYEMVPVPELDCDCAEPEAFGFDSAALSLASPEKNTPPT